MTDGGVIGAVEAADRLGVDKSTLIRWIAAGRIAAEKLSGQTGAYVLHPADVEKLRDEIAEQVTA